MKNKPLSLHLSSLCLFLMGFFTTMTILTLENNFDNISQFFNIFFIYVNIVPSPAMYALAISHSTSDIIFAYSLIAITIISYFFLALFIQLKKSIVPHIIIIVVLSIDIASTLLCLISLYAGFSLTLILSIIFKIFPIVFSAKNIRWINKSNITTANPV